MQAIKNILPLSLYGRTLVILLAPIVLVVVVTSTVFLDRHWDSVTKRLAADIASEVSAILDLSKYHENNYEYVMNFAKRHFAIDVKFLKGTSSEIVLAERSRAFGQSYLKRSLDKFNYSYLTSITDNKIEIAIDAPRGVWVMQMPRKRLLDKSTPIFLMWLIGAPFLFTLIAALFLRNQVRPIRKLAEAMDAFGKGRDIVGSFKPQGAVEVRQAANAFNLMRLRIARQVSQRTEMLAGVSHDLRTPLTRMALALEMLPKSQEIEDLKNDVKDMRKMVEAFLDFTKDGERESAIITDVSEMLVSLISKSKKTVNYKIPENLVQQVKPDTLKRCFVNVIENACRYANNVWVEAEKNDDGIVVYVDDDGPGIPEENRKDVFKPFFRLDSARNQDVAGTGLGLSIAQDAVSQHGGRILLTDSQYGGLKVTIFIPN